VIFETAFALRGLDNLLVDFVRNPEMAEALLERLTRLRCSQARAYAQAGVDVLLLGDDVSSQQGMLMHPRLWRRFLKPRLARVIEAARSVNSNTLIFYHSDGDCQAIIPELIEVGVNILNPVQPECMDPAVLKRQFGDRLAFWGTLGTQTTFPFGSPEEMRRVVWERIETVGRGGGLLLAPTHILEPEVPWENVLAFFEAIDEYYERKRLRKS
jgi:uroporphyrinogen decarboxylase